MTDIIILILVNKI